MSEQMEAQKAWSRRVAEARRIACPQCRSAVLAKLTAEGPDHRQEWKP